MDGDEDVRTCRRRLLRERKHVYGFGVVLWFPRDTASPLRVSRQAGEMLGIHGGPHVARSFVILIFMVIFVFYSLNRF